MKLLALTIVFLACAAFASAQDRMPPIPVERMTDAQKKAIAEFEVARVLNTTRAPLYAGHGPALTPFPC